MVAPPPFKFINIIMKQFNLEEAKKGHKVCTRNGLPARIINFDRKDNTYPIVALVDNGGHEDVLCFTKEGKWLVSTIDKERDLFMVGEKHEGWINLYSEVGGMIVPGFSIFLTKEEAIKNSFSSKNRIDTIKIEWEE